MTDDLFRDLEEIGQELERTTERLGDDRPAHLRVVDPDSEAVEQLRQEVWEAPAPDPVRRPAAPTSRRVYGPERPRRRPWVRGLGRLLQGVGLLYIAAVLAVALWFGYLALRSPGGTSAIAPAGGSGQRAVAWLVRAQGGSGFLVVAATGGGKPAVVVAVPTNVVTSIAGHGTGTVDDAVRTGDPSLVAAVAENLLGVRVRGIARTSLDSLAATVDRLGGIESGGRRMSGSQVVSYLRLKAPDIRFLRWTEVLSAVLPALHEAPSALQGVPHGVGSVLTDAGDSEVVTLPVEDSETGLVRPDAPALARLVAERFEVPAGGDPARLVVLNGNGEPGIGERVARILVPNGFRLVSSQNAPRFGIDVTRIVASSAAFLDDARHARRLLGVGRVVLGTQPTGVADVSIVVGEDFGGR